MSLSDGRRGGLALASAAAAGAVILGIVTQQPDAPAAPGDVGSIASDSAGPNEAPVAPHRSRSDEGRARYDVEAAAEQPLGRSRPVSISIPSIDVRSDVFEIGLAEDGSLAVPQPGPRLDLAAWFDGSPTPGQPGPAIIEGHVATEQRGPSVFFELGALRPGDEITVRRADDRVVTFTVRALRTFDKDEFPTRLVYGGDLSTPQLRLITCSDFNPESGDHEGNLVVFSELTDVSEA